jgi:Spy/CpxP family protein refolding chaperone
MSFRMNRRRWVGLSLAGVVGAGALGALLAAPAFGRGGLFGHGHGGWGRHGHQRLDEAHIRAHVEWLLRGNDATPEQIEEITRIASAAAQELHGLRDRGRETVDRAALEALRAEHVAALEDGSRKLTDALAQVAEVLTPAQRAALAAQHEKWSALRGGDAE